MTVKWRYGTGPAAWLVLKKMKLEMPRSFTDHPLSRKVEHLKLYAKKFYMLSNVS